MKVLLLIVLAVGTAAVVSQQETILKLQSDLAFEQMQSNHKDCAIEGYELLENHTREPNNPAYFLETTVLEACRIQ